MTLLEKLKRQWVPGSNNWRLKSRRETTRCHASRRRFHEILFSNGWHVRLRFRSVDVVVAHRLERAEQPVRSAHRAVARSA
jgi:hypothetical protein